MSEQRNKERRKERKNFGRKKGNVSRRVEWLYRQTARKREIERERQRG